MSPSALYTASTQRKRSLLRPNCPFIFFFHAMPSPNLYLDKQIMSKIWKGLCTTTMIYTHDNPSQPLDNPSHALYSYSIPPPLAAKRLTLPIAAPPYFALRSRGPINIKNEVKVTGHGCGYSWDVESGRRGDVCIGGGSGLGGEVERRGKRKAEESKTGKEKSTEPSKRRIGNEKPRVCLSPSIQETSILVPILVLVKYKPSRYPRWSRMNPQRRKLPLKASHKVNLQAFSVSSSGPPQPSMW